MMIREHLYPRICSMHKNSNFYPR